jgi:hypothetical protein
LASLLLLFRFNKHLRASASGGADWRLAFSITPVCRVLARVTIAVFAPSQKNNREYYKNFYHFNPPNNFQFQTQTSRSLLFFLVTEKQFRDV